jgi:hypothetical protein
MLIAKQKCLFRACEIDLGFNHFFKGISFPINDDKIIS